MYVPYHPWCGELFRHRHYHLPLASLRPLVLRLPHRSLSLDVLHEGKLFVDVHVLRRRNNEGRLVVWNVLVAALLEMRVWWPSL